MSRNAGITSSGYFAPEKVVTNQYFNDLLGEDVGTWLVENLTIEERRWCSENESASTLCTRAALNTLAKTGITPADLDLIIVATDTPEYISPSTAAVVQHNLSAVNAGTFDVNTACAGFVTALDMASKYIQADTRYNNILVIGVYAMSKYIDMTDKKTMTLFADGAGAVLLQPCSEDSGWLASELRGQGEYHDWMGIYAGGTKFPITHEAVDERIHLLRFVKKFPKEINPAVWTEMVRSVIGRTKYSLEDVDHLFFTQININSIRETMDNLGLPMEKTHTIMRKYGYTGSACIPMALAEADSLGKVKKGDLIVFMGSGGGLSFACAAYKW